MTRMRQEILRVERCTDADERLWRLREIEAIAQVVGSAVGIVETRHAEVLFGEMKNAAELVLDVRHVAVPRIGRDDEQRHAEAQTHLVELWRGNVIVPTAPIIPGDEDGRAAPKRARTD